MNIRRWLPSTSGMLSCSAWTQDNGLCTSLSNSIQRRHIRSLLPSVLGVCTSVKCKWLSFSESWLLNTTTTSLIKNHIQGHLGDSVGWASDFGSGHDLMVCEFELRADSSEPGACFGFCVSLSLFLPSSHSLSLKNKYRFHCLSIKNQWRLKKNLSFLILDSQEWKMFF